MRSILRFATAVAASLALGVPLSGSLHAEELAKNLFGSMKLPAVAARPQSIGFYSKGCFVGGVELPDDGANWQSMRLSRNRHWGLPVTINMIEKLARDAAAKDGWPGLMVGDISQPRGGPMRDGHASHQIGLDVDIWFTPMPNRRLSISERETIKQVSMIKRGGLTVNDKVWTDSRMRLLRRAASYPEVERILVHPGIKKKLCETVTGDRSWLRKVRPFWGHDEHFHVRIGCQPGSPLCKEQAAPPPGDGCDGKALAWWFTAEPWRPAKNPDAPKARDVMTLKALPKECRAVLALPAPGETGNTAVATVLPDADTDAAPAAATPESMGINAFAPTPDIGVPLPRDRPPG
ncbi:MAG: penicillin-insensitive murein endopeptidase [Rhizobiales bacterium]|nr:penicillin-insensitive murein endopeptidase [Hyphomicrobiales bacterium]